MVGEIWIIPKNVFWKFCEIERFVSARHNRLRYKFSTVN